MNAELSENRRGIASQNVRIAVLILHTNKRSTTNNTIKRTNNKTTTIKQTTTNNNNNNATKTDNGTFQQQQATTTSEQISKQRTENNNNTARTEINPATPTTHPTIANFGAAQSLVANNIVSLCSAQKHCHNDQHQHPRSGAVEWLGCLRSNSNSENQEF